MQTEKPKKERDLTQIGCWVMAIGLLASATAGLYFFIQEGLTVAAALWLAGGSIVTVIASLALIAIGFRKDGSGED